MATRTEPAAMTTRSAPTPARTSSKPASPNLSTTIDAVEARIDTLQRVIWSLLVLLASTVFGLLYRVVTA